MAEYLEQAIERITREHYDNNPSVYFSKAGIAYREGMSDRIVERLRSRRWEQEREARAKAAEEKTRAAHPAYAGTPTANALTIVDVRLSEDEANERFLHDAKWGEGAYDREKAEMAAWRAQWAEQRRLEKEAEERFKLEQPEAWAKREAERKEAQEKADREARRREERNAKRRTGSGRYYRGPSVRHEDYYSGHERGGTVSLDQQVTKHETRGIK